MLAGWQNVETPPVMYSFLPLGRITGVLEDVLAQLNIH